MKAIVLVSGGLDSAVCLAKAAEQHGNENVIALNMYYGQRHKKECLCAKALAGHFGVQYMERDMTDVFLGSHDALLEPGKNVPEGSYEEQIKAENGEPITAVPFRNGVFMSIVTSMALQYECDEVWCGIHQGDSQATYYDCQEDFVDFMSAAIYVGTGEKIKLMTPFLHKRKVDVVVEGDRLKVPFSLTWSCYNGGDKPCGKCGTCIERADAFSEAGIVDPLMSSSV